MKIIELAKEAGFTYYDEYPSSLTERFKRFAALVAAHEREAVLEIVHTIGGNFAYECAAAIRARSEK